MKRSTIISIFLAMMAVLAFTHPVSAYYHPGIGRWTSRDSRGIQVGSALDLSPSNEPSVRFIQRDRPVPELQYRDSMSLYQYVRSNPVRHTDPEGRYTLLQVRVTYCEAKYKWMTDPFARGDSIMACADNIAGTQTNFDLWYEASKKEMGWLAGLPDCPCSIKCTNVKKDIWANPDSKVWDDPHNITNGAKYHPGAHKEIRSLNSNGWASGQQCTYDNAGDLITHGYGAGTPDRIHSWPAWGVFGAIGVIGNWARDGGHIGHDVSPFDLAYKLDGNLYWKNVDKYIEVRPPNNGNQCKRNP